MKKIVNMTESDFNRIVKKVINEDRNNIERWFLRRRGLFESALEKLIEEEDPCEYGDEFTYADTMITSSLEEIFDYDEYENFEDELVDILKEEFGEQLFDNYYSSDCD